MGDKPGNIVMSGVRGGGGGGGGVDTIYCSYVQISLGVNFLLL